MADSEHTTTSQKARRALPIAVVLALTGTVFVVGMDGAKRLLKLGDELFSDDRVATGEDGDVMIGFADGSQVELGGNSEAVLDGEVFDAALLAGMSPEQITAIQQMILDGADPSEILAATAAGTGGMGEGGHSYVRVDMTGDTSDPSGLGVATEGLVGGAGGADVQTVGDSSGLSVAASTYSGGDDEPGDEPPPPPEPELPTVSIGDVFVREPAQEFQPGQGENPHSGEGQGNLTGRSPVPAEFTVTLSEASDQTVTVQFTVLDGSASSAGSVNGQGTIPDFKIVTDADPALTNVVVDANGKGGTITFEPGETTATIEFLVYGDSEVEIDPEDFSIVLSDPVNATLADDTGVAAIADNEPHGYMGEVEPPMGDGGDAGGAPGGAGMVGSEGDDTLIGGKDDDGIAGLEGDDLLRGSAGDDQLYGGGDDDTLEGSAGDDLLQGGSGDDTMYGGSGNDQLIGNTGDDSLQGDAGDDVLIGGEGADTLDGGQGLDILVGGGGADTFKFDQISGPATDSDVVLDFNPAQGDAIDLSDVLDSGVNSGNIADYVKIEASADDPQHYELKVSPSGGDDFTVLATLQNYAGEDDDVANLLASQNIIIN